MNTPTPVADELVASGDLTSERAIAAIKDLRQGTMPYLRRRDTP
jgi:hypothetical protein